jgi:LPXTG-motif cell wall-anchored protein
VLTVFASIFIPITFVASVYGMNFIALPGSESPIGFWVLLGLMVLSVAALLWFFRRKGWLTGIPSTVGADARRSSDHELGRNGKGSKP